MVASAIESSQIHDVSNGDLIVRFVSQSEMANLHETFLGKPGPTNVLTFADVESGEVAICPKVAAEDARTRGWEETTELIYLCVHGSLHALGFEHITRSDAARMRDSEIQILSNLGIDTTPLESHLD